MTVEQLRAAIATMPDKERLIWVIGTDPETDETDYPVFLVCDIKEEDGEYMLVIPKNSTREAQALLKSALTNIANKAERTNVKRTKTKASKS